LDLNTKGGKGASHANGKQKWPKGRKKEGGEEYSFLLPKLGSNQKCHPLRSHRKRRELKIANEEGRNWEGIFPEANIIPTPPPLPSCKVPKTSFLFFTHFLLFFPTLKHAIPLMEYLFILFK
jgi:hypothetical protein